MQHLFDGYNIQHVLYADDLQIYIQVPRQLIEEGILSLSLIAKKVSEWSRHSGLRLNPSKTQAIYFAPKHLVTKIENMELRGIELESGITVPFSECVLSLGMVLHRSLSWKHHIDHVTKKSIE